MEKPSLCSAMEKDDTSSGSSKDSRCKPRSFASCKRPIRSTKVATTEEEAQSMLRKAALKVVVSVLCGHAGELLEDDERRHSLRLRCSAKLKAEAWAEAQYGEQAILANLDWGIDAVESALKEEGGSEARDARLQNAQRMLGVAAIMDSHSKVRSQQTCGVANAYIAAWAHFYLALACRIRDNDLGCALHLLGTFTTCPTYARLHFAPEVWHWLFLPYIQEAFSYDDEVHAHLHGSLNDISDEIACIYAQYYKDWLLYEASLYERRGFRSPELEPPSSPILAGALIEATEDGQTPASSYNFDRVSQGKDLSSEEVHPPLTFSSTQDVVANSLKGFFLPVGKYGAQKISINNERVTNELHAQTCLDAKTFMQKKQLDHISAIISKGYLPTSPLAACLESGPEDQTKCLASMPNQAWDSNLKKIEEVSFSMDCAALVQEAGHLREVSNVDGQESSTVLLKNSVTIKAGQTYQPKANGEQLEKGNTNFSEILYPLEITAPPSTNKTLEDLLDKWQENDQFLDNFHDDQTWIKCTKPRKERPGREVEFMTRQTNSPSAISGCVIEKQSIGSNSNSLLGSRFRQKNLKWNSTEPPISESVLIDLNQAVAMLCTAENIVQCEESIKQICRIWVGSRGSPDVESVLTKTAVIHELIEALPISNVTDVLQGTICILSALMIKDEAIRKTVLRIDNDLKIVSSLLRSVPQTSIMLYILEQSDSPLSLQKLIIFLVGFLINTETLIVGISHPCKSTVILLLEQLVTAFDEERNTDNARNIATSGAIPCLIDTLDTGDSLEEKKSAANILQHCMKFNWSVGECGMLPHKPENLF